MNKKQRYSGRKDRVYEDRHLKFFHVSRPLVQAIVDGKLRMVLAPKGHGITYRRPEPKKQGWQP
jgi:hypothetical protein